MEKPNCYKCVHRLEIPGNAHSRCNNVKANVKGHEQGRRGGWFRWPLNYDPVWLLECDGFSDNIDDKKERVEYDSITEISALLK